MDSNFWLNEDLKTRPQFPSELRNGQLLTINQLVACKYQFNPSATCSGTNQRAASCYESDNVIYYSTH